MLDTINNSANSAPAVVVIVVIAVLVCVIGIGSVFFVRTIARRQRRQIAMG
jgi:hypothetical protein